MRLHPFALIGSIVHLSCHFMGGLFARIHQRVLLRRSLSPVLPFPPPSPPSPLITVDLSPTEVETLVVSEAVSEMVYHLIPDWAEETEPAISSTPASESVAELVVNESVVEVETASAPDRTQFVITLLDEAYAQGYTTYPTLIAYVKAHTGTGCSRRVISAWKRSRKLSEMAA